MDGFILRRRQPKWQEAAAAPLRLIPLARKAHCAAGLRQALFGLGKNHGPSASFLSALELNPSTTPIRATVRGVLPPAYPARKVKRNRTNKCTRKIVFGLDPLFLRCQYHAQLLRTCLPEIYRRRSVGESAWRLVRSLFSRGRPSLVSAKAAGSRTVCRRRRPWRVAAAIR